MSKFENEFELQHFLVIPASSSSQDSIYTRANLDYFLIGSSKFVKRLPILDILQRIPRIPWIKLTLEVVKSNASIKNSK